jgi:glycosyltransferase involved in cell wall biosynthesis
MHITFILQDMYRLGAQYVTSMIANGLSERGHRVDVIVSAVESKIKKERSDLEPFPLNKEIAKIELTHLKASKNIGEIRNYLKQRQPDVIIPMSSNYSLATALAMLVFSTKTKLLPVEHSGGIGMSYMKASKSNLFIDWASNLTNLILISKACGFITVSKGVKDAMVKTQKIDPKKLHVIYNPVIGKTFNWKVAQTSQHLWLVEKELPVIVAAGAHIPLKGYDVLVNAMALVNKEYPCKLVLFGEGILTEELKKLAKTNAIDSMIDFPGHTKNLPAELKNADAFVVSSHAESFSVVLVEALASAIPVVATNCPSGPPEILQNGKFGILVEPNSPKELAKGILKVLKGKGILPAKESWEPYQIEKIVISYEEVIQSVLNS